MSHQGYYRAIGPSFEAHHSTHLTVIAPVKVSCYDGGLRPSCDRLGVQCVPLFVGRQGDQFFNSGSLRHVRDTLASHERYIYVGLTAAYCLAFQALLNFPMVTLCF